MWRWLCLVAQRPSGPRDPPPPRAPRRHKATSPSCVGLANPVQFAFAVHMFGRLRWRAGGAGVARKDEVSVAATASTRQGTHTQAWIRFVLHAHAVRLKMHHETHLTHQPPSYCWPPTFTEIKTPPGPPPARDAQQLLCRRASWKSSARARACTSEAKVSPCWGAMRRLERCSLQEREARSQLVPPAWLPMHMGCVQ